VLIESIVYGHARQVPSFDDPMRSFSIVWSHQTNIFAFESASACPGCTSETQARGVRVSDNAICGIFGADIVADDLALIRRVAALEGLAGRIDTHLIDDDLSFAGLAPGYDVIWVVGSIHHVPFEIARCEALAVLALLKPGGRWLREGALPFADWGRMTDGERTPWAEWHDIEKVRRRLAPAAFATVLDFGFRADNYRWVDLEYAGIATAAGAASSASIDLLLAGRLQLTGGRRQRLSPHSWSIVCPAGGFADAAELDLRPHLARLGASRAIALDLEVRVMRGAVGIGLLDESGAYLSAAEAVVMAGEDWRPVTLRAVGGRPAMLRVRNMHAGRRGNLTVRTAIVRSAS
jgi:hypothetical protein